MTHAAFIIYQRRNGTRLVSTELLFRYRNLTFIGIRVAPNLAIGVFHTGIIRGFAIAVCDAIFDDLGFNAHAISAAFVLAIGVIRAILVAVPRITLRHLNRTRAYAIAEAISLTIGIIDAGIGVILAAFHLNGFNASIVGACDLAVCVAGAGVCITGTRRNLDGCTALSVHAYRQSIGIICARISRSPIQCTIMDDSR